MEELSARVRIRIFEELKRQKLNQRAFADRLKWTPSRLGKVLHGTTDLTVDDMAAMCEELRLSVVEAIRDRGMEFMADMSASELRILDRIRQLDAIDKANQRPNATTDAIFVLLDVRQHTSQQSRRAAPAKKVRGPVQK